MWRQTHDIIEMIANFAKETYLKIPLHQQWPPGKLDAFKDSLNEADTQSQLNELNKRFELNELKMQAERQQMEAEREKMEAERRQMYLIFALVLLTILGTTLFFYFRRRAAKRLAAVKAEQERIENELNIARDIQMSMVPSTFPELEGLDMYAAMTPAKEVGGDLYGYVINGSQLYFAVGDVSGKGVPASLFMAQATHPLVPHLGSSGLGAGSHLHSYEQRAVGRGQHQQHVRHQVHRYAGYADEPPEVLQRRT